VRTKYLILILALGSFASCKEAPVLPGDAKNPPSYKKADLQKLRWIEGNWKSEVAGTGYYQTYHFPSDSILEVVSYRYDGKDTSGTTVSRVYWKNNHIYLGTYDEWVAVLLDKTSIQLAPTHLGWIAINWTQNSKDEWTSVQKKPDFERTVKMKRQPPLMQLIKK